MPERSFASQDFIDGLAQFKCYQYMYENDPYLYLHSFVGQKDVLYDQFSQLLLDDAVSKGASRGTVELMIKHIANEMDHELDHAREIQRLIDRSVRNNRGNDKVLLFPITCGIGKSTAVSYKMQSALKSKENESLLILTDNKDLLRSYVEPYKKDLRDFFARQDNRNRYCIFIAETKAEALRRADNAQILLMTTQRYMHMSRKELDRFTSYRGKRRSMIIIDEQPEVVKYETIKFSDLQGVVSSFIQGLPYSTDPALVAEKTWCLNYWRSIEDVCSRLLAQIDRESEGKPGYYRFLRPTELIICEEDEERFMSFIRRNRADLDTYEGGDEYDKVMANIEAVFEMLHHGALFCSRNDQRRTKTCFKLFIDRIAQFDVPDTKIAILDGTAAISPMYQVHKDRYKPINRVWQFRRSLNNLHIHVLSYRTGRDALIGQEEYQDEIIQDIRKRTAPYQAKPVIFTYKNTALLEKFSHEFGTDNVAYLGNLRGFNTFYKTNVIAQVGMNQFPTECYYLMTLVEDHSERERFLAMSAEEQRSAIGSAVNSRNTKIKEIMLNCLLTDTEQNMFRGGIRELTGKPYHFFLYCSVPYYRSLIDAMIERYHSMDGHVNPDELSLAERIEAYMRSGKPDKYGNRILRAIFSYSPGEQFSAYDIYSLAGMTYDQYKQVVRRADVLKKLLEYDYVSDNLYQSKFQMPSESLIAASSSEQTDYSRRDVYVFYENDDEEDNLLPF